MRRGPRHPGEDMVELLAWIVRTTPALLAADPTYVAFPRVRQPDGTWTVAGPAKGEDAPEGRPLS